MNRYVLGAPGCDLVGTLLGRVGAPRQDIVGPKWKPRRDLIGKADEETRGEIDMVYSMVVRRRVRSTFDQINAGNYADMVEGLASPFEYVFHGEHALGGRRVTKEAMNRWWQRTFRLLPGAKFDVQDVIVSGGRGTLA